MVDALDELLPPMGHNRPAAWISLGLDGKIALDSAAMRDWLSGEVELLIARRDALLGSVERCPAVVKDEDTAKRTADLIKAIAACIKNAEADRVSRKEPILEAGRVTDGVYRAITDPLAKAKATVEGRLTIYQREVAAAERRRREAEEAAAREEAARRQREAAEAAAKLKTEEDLARAISAEELAKQAAADAEHAAKEAAAKPAELSRQRSDLGSVASLRTFIDVTDISREYVDLETLRPYLALDAIEKALRLFIRAGGRTISGARIFENTATSVR